MRSPIRETLVGLNERTSMLKQSVRDQKAGEKEVHHVRQTLRSLPSVTLIHTGIEKWGRPSKAFGFIPKE